MTAPHGPYGFYDGVGYKDVVSSNNKQPTKGTTATTETYRLDLLFAKPPPPFVVEMPEECRPTLGSLRSQPRQVVKDALSMPPREQNIMPGSGDNIMTPPQESKDGKSTEFAKPPPPLAEIGTFMEDSIASSYPRVVVEPPNKTYGMESMGMNPLTVRASSSSSSSSGGVAQPRQSQHLSMMPPREADIMPGGATKTATATTSSSSSSSSNGHSKWGMSFAKPPPPMVHRVPPEEVQAAKHPAPPTAQEPVATTQPPVVQDDEAPVHVPPQPVMDSVPEVVPANKADAGTQRLSMRTSDPPLLPPPPPAPRASYRPKVFEVATLAMQPVGPPPQVVVESVAPEMPPLEPTNAVPATEYVAEEMIVEAVMPEPVVTEQPEIIEEEEKTVEELLGELSTEQLKALAAQLKEKEQILSSMTLEQLEALVEEVKQNEYSDTVVKEPVPVESNKPIATAPTVPSMDKAELDRMRIANERRIQEMRKQRLVAAKVTAPMVPEAFKPQPQTANPEIVASSDSVKVEEKGAAASVASTTPPPYEQKIAEINSQLETMKVVPAKETLDHKRSSSPADKTPQPSRIAAMRQQRLVAAQAAVLAKAAREQKTKQVKKAASNLNVQNAGSLMADESAVWESLN